MPAEAPMPTGRPARGAYARLTAVPVHCELVLADACSFLPAKKPPAPAEFRPAARWRFVPKFVHTPAACRSQQSPAHLRTARARSAVDSKATTRPDDKTAASRRFAAAS